MEDTHWGPKFFENEDNVGLNPCFNGRYSLSTEQHTKGEIIEGLNPCFNGRYSLRVKTCIPLYAAAPCV